MPDAAHHAHPDRAELAGVLERFRSEAEAYLTGLDELPVRVQRADAAAAAFAGPLPFSGEGAESALCELVELGRDALITSAGPRFFHFVIGGATPAALGGDLLASAFDQVASSWITSPLAVQLERTSIAWLLELFDLPPSWTGVMTTGAMMANYTGLVAARQWWGERQDIDVATHGMSGLPPVPIYSSGFLHASSYKALAMLGIGRGAARCFSRDSAGRLDLEGMEASLRALEGVPAILIANAGEVNAGEFDPIEEMANLAERFGCWLHVDGAFGLFARVSERTAALARGVERADSVTVDGHKWLNVPYDCGISFVRDPELLRKTLTLAADYLPTEAGNGMLCNLCPESSRRARAFAVWATLRAYGRQGVVAMVERHLDLAQRLAERVDAAPELQRLADVPLNIVCFRYDPGGPEAPGEEELERLNQRLGERILEDGRVFAGTTRFEGKTALRPALVNWRTRDEDVDLFVDVVRELAAELHD